MSSKSLLLAVFFLGALALRAPAYPSTPNSVTAALWNFNSGDGSFAVANSAGVEGPWTYDPTVGIGGTGGWFANGSGAVGVPTSSVLTSPTLTITARGPVTLSFDHRYSFEYDGVRWDGGNVRVSVNGGPFVVVGNSQFTINGYTGVITGHGILTDQEGFNSDSPGYATPAFIRSIAELGDFQAGETIAIQFAAGWDELALGSRPSWVIDNVCVVEIPADTPPTITQQPQSQTAAIGRDVTFSVMGAGTAPLTYRWIFCPKPYWDQPTNILAATGATLTLSKVQPIDAGDYLAVVSNGFGSVTSRVATLTVCLPMINPSFEADRFSITPGYVLNNGPITGWSGSDANGINPGGGVSPFADNGTIPRGNQVAFLQGGDPISQSSTLSQRVSGFTVGAEYYVQYYENARNCCSGTVPFLEVKIGGATIVAAHPVPPVGGTNPYARVISRTFTASASSLELDFIKSNPQGGDTTALIDDVCIVVAPGRPTSQLPVGFGFEPEDGYGLGDLNGQRGWVVERGTAEVWGKTVYSGTQAARIAPGGQISHDFATGCPIVTFSAYLQASPSSAPEIPLLAQAAVLYLDPTYGLTGLDGDGSGGGHWVGSGVVIPAGTWFQITLKLDFDRKTWECAVNGRPALSGLHFHSDNVMAFASLEAAASSGDTLVDEAQVIAASAPLPSDLNPIAQFPFGLGFETEEGYLLGDLDSQNGWTVQSGEAEVWTQTVYSGAQAARIAPGGQISHDFAAGCPIVTFSAFMQASPSSAPEIPLLAQAAVLYLDPTYGLTGLDGDGNGGGNWVGSGVVIPAGTWFQVTLKLDFDRKSWECAVNGRPVLSGLHFHSDNVMAFASLEAAASGGDTLVDAARVTAESAPLPSDLDPISQFPFGLGFELEEGYLLGDLDSQNGWTVDSGEAEVWTQTVYSGTQAARITPGGQISHEFAAGCPIVTFSAFLQASPSSVPEIPLMAQAAVLYLDPTYGLTALDGDGKSGGNWVGSGVMIPAGTWFEVTLKLDFDRKIWACAVNGRPALSGLHFHSDSVMAFASLAAAASSGDTLVDAMRVNVDDAPPPREISLLPAGFGFEPEEGYPLGNLDKRNGWRVESGKAQVWSKKVHSGVQAAQIQPGGQISHDFATACPIVTFDAYLQATPSAPPEIPDTAQIAVLYLDAVQGITGLDGDGNGGGNWVGSGVTVPSDAWFQATIRVDFVSKTWSCAVNGKQVLSQMHFHANSISTFSSFMASAHRAGETLLDQISFLAENGSLSLPVLTISLAGAAVEVSWPADFEGYRLQATASLANPGWTDVVTSGNHVSEQIDRASRFYRLIAP